MNTILTKFASQLETVKHSNSILRRVQPGGKDRKQPSRPQATHAQLKIKTSIITIFTQKKMPSNLIRPERKRSSTVTI
jgi:hypothetical protein